MQQRERYQVTNEFTATRPDENTQRTMTPGETILADPDHWRGNNIIEFFHESTRLGAPISVFENLNSQNKLTCWHAAVTDLPRWCDPLGLEGTEPKQLQNLFISR